MKHTKVGLILPTASLGAIAAIALLMALPLRADLPEPGTISTVAGTGSHGFEGDGSPAAAARLNQPRGLALDGAGNLFIADSGNYRVRRVSPDGTITTVAGKGRYTNRTRDGGLATAAIFDEPCGVAVDSEDNLFITDASRYDVWKVRRDGVITTALRSDRVRKWPLDVAVDRAGNLFIPFSGQNGVFKVSSDGMVTPVAGSRATDDWWFAAGFSGDGGPATSALLNDPQGVALDGMGNLFTADSGNHRIRKVSPDVTITTVAGSGSEGVGKGDYGGDGGLALQARLNRPRGVAVDSAGNLFIADFGNGRVRKVSPDGTITTIAGGGTGDPGDGGAATAALLNDPWGVAVDGAGNLYISEYGSHRIRKVAGAAAPGLLAGGPFPDS